MKRYRIKLKAREQKRNHAYWGEQFPWLIRPVWSAAFYMKDKDELKFIFACAPEEIRSHLRE